MHLPRVRLTVGQLLVAVAVVAGNCGVLRLRDELIVKIDRNEIEQDRIRQNALIDEAPRSILCFDLLGFLPLINVVLIGLLFVARKLWSFRGQNGANLRPFPLGFTYFISCDRCCCHYLHAGRVSSAILEIFTPLVHYAAKECWTVVSRILGDSPLVDPQMLDLRRLPFRPGHIPLMDRRLAHETGARRNASSATVPGDDLPCLARLHRRGSDGRGDTPNLRG